ncbi:MAG: type VI secretion system ImpA family N-terminal domain-containing protein [Paracoccaceae bacterium]
MSDPLKPLNPNLYAPVSDDAPCGPVLDRSAFVALDGMCTEIPGKFDHLTRTDLPATPPDFRAARPAAIKLLEESRDLRPLSHLIQIEANVNGALGLHAAAHLLLHLCETEWEGLHPGPASEEAELNQRRRALDRIRNRRRVVIALEGGTIFKSKSVFGEVRLRDLMMATGALQAPGGETPADRSAIAEMIANADAVEAVTETRKALDATAKIFRRLGKLFEEKFDRPILLGSIPEDLEKYAKVVAEFESPGEPVASEGGSEDEQSIASATPEQSQSAHIGPISSPEDADLLLDGILGFYAQSAPSSPIALILLRLRELRSASFIDWIDATGSNGPEKAAFELGNVDVSALQSLAEPSQDAQEDVSHDDLGKELSSGIDTLETALGHVGAALDQISVANATDSPEELPDFASDASSGEPVETVAEAPSDNLTVPDLSEVRAQIVLLREIAERVAAAQAANATTSNSASRNLGSVNGRTAVKTALEQLAAFHENRDPANPMQTILRRTKGLVDLNYLDTLAELSPGGGKPALPLIRPEPKSRG